MVKLVDLYRSTAEQFAERLVRQFPGVHAVVLYGSVAYGKPRRDSDIDILILSDDPEALRSPAADLRSAIDAATGYRTHVSCQHLTIQHFKWLLEIGAPFAEDVRNQGMVLYDDGSYEAIRQTVPVEG